MAISINDVKKSLENEESNSMVNKDIMNVITEIVHSYGINFKDNAEILAMVAKNIENGHLSDDEYGFEGDDDINDSKEIKEKLDSFATDEEREDYLDSNEYETQKKEIIEAPYKAFFNLILKILQSKLAAKISTLTFGGWPDGPDISYWKTIMGVIAENKYITHFILTLSGNTDDMDSEFGVALCHALKKNKTIRSLWLNDLEFDRQNSANVQSVARLLPVLSETNITELSMRIDGRDKGQLCVDKELAQLMSDHNTQLLRLSLFDFEWSGFLARAMFRNRSLTFLELSRMEFENQDNPIEILPILLEDNRSLLTLKLHWGFSNCYSGITKALKVNQTLTSLQLDGLKLTKEDSSAFSDALKENGTLNTLVLVNNDAYINESQALILSNLIPGLLVNRGLTCLKATGSEISKSVFSIFAAAFMNLLKTNRNLIELCSPDIWSSNGIVSFVTGETEKGEMISFRHYLARNQRLRRNWLHVILLEKFMIANIQNKSFRTSIIPLVPGILNLTYEDRSSLLEHYEPKPPLFDSKTLSKFMLTRYFQSQLESAVTLAELAASKESVIKASNASFSKASSSSSSVTISEIDEKSNLEGAGDDITSNTAVENARKRKYS